MKKALSLLTMMVVFAAATFAQTGTEIYAMKNITEADMVLKAINSQVKLTDSEFSKVRELLYKSAESQGEQSAKNTDASQTAVMVTRQTNHIEAGLKNLLGEEKYKQYETAKTSIASQVKTLKGN